MSLNFSENETSVPYSLSLIKKLRVHFLFFLRDSVKLCLGPTLHFFENLSSLLPILSLIFEANIHRLSLNSYFEMKYVCERKPFLRFPIFDMRCA